MEKIKRYTAKQIHEMHYGGFCPELESMEFVESSDVATLESRCAALEESTTLANANAGMWHGVAVRKAEELDESDTLRIGAEYTNEIYEKRIGELEKRLEDAETLAKHWMSGDRAYPFTEKHNTLHAAAKRILSRTGKEEGDTDEN